MCRFYCIINSGYIHPTAKKKKIYLEKHSRRARNGILRAIIYQVELRPESRCPVPWSYYLSRSVTKKIGAREEGNKGPPARTDKTSHWWNWIWLFAVQCTCAISHPFQNLRGPEGWTVLILQTVSKLRSEERQKLNLSWHFLPSKLPLSCDAQLSFSMEKEKLFSITKNGFPFLPISVQLHPTELSLKEPQAGRQMSLCPLICASLSQGFSSKSRKSECGRRLQPDWEWLQEVSPKKVFYFRCKRKKSFNGLDLMNLKLDQIPIRQEPKTFPVWQKHIQTVIANCCPSFDLKGLLSGITVMRLQFCI